MIVHAASLGDSPTPPAESTNARQASQPSTKYSTTWPPLPMRVARNPAAGSGAAATEELNRITTITT
jgi:hypothetical protein